MVLISFAGAPFREFGYEKSRTPVPAAPAQPGFRLIDANASAVAQVVRRLDGIPLAIELAAARLRMFSVEQVAARLDQRFRLLAGGSRTAMPRQQTLRALIDWSYDLLDDDERDLFRKLSVFVGGWTFEAAESVAGTLDAYTLLPQLVGKSLVMREIVDESETLPDDILFQEPRYAYLETIRQYARDRLVESGSVEEARARHFAYFEELGRHIEFGAYTSSRALQGDRLQIEQDNLRAAIEWSIDHYPERTLYLIWKLTPYISDQLPGTEAIEWTASALQRLDSLPPAADEEAEHRQQARLSGVVALSMLKMYLGQLNDAGRIADETIELLQDGDAHLILLANALFVKAQIGYFLEDPSLDETLAQAEGVLRRMEDHPVKQLLLAMILMLAAESASRKGNVELLERYFQESKVILENAASAFLPWLEYSRLLVMLEMDLEPEEVREQYEKTVEKLRQVSSGRMAAMAESDWAHKMRYEGNLDEALEIYRRMLVEWRKLGHRAAMANILENMAFVDRIQGRPERAVTFLGAAERIREATGQGMLRLEREEYERELDELKQSLDAQILDSLWAKGRTLATDAVIALALQEED